MNDTCSPVLLVDDQHELAELMACFLARAGIQPVIAVNGIAALVQARTLLPSLILCDANMPEMSGLDVIDALRANPATAHIPIVLVSGDDPARFDGSGANAFLQKPFMMNEMVTLVQSYIAPRPAAPIQPAVTKALKAKAEREAAKKLDELPLTK